MAPSQITEDYYKVLGIPQSAGSDAIRTSYRKLALKYHPDRNPNNPQATAQFQLLEAAYSTLFDPERRRLYDIQYESIKRNSAKPDASQNPPPPQASNKKPDQSYKIQMEKLEATIQQLRNRKDELARQLAKARDELQAQADMDAEEEASRNSWYGYFFAKSQSAEEKLARQRRMVDNRAARTVREAELKRLTSRVATAQSLVEDIQRRVQEKVSERHRLQMQETRRQQDARLAELRRQQAMQREREERAREEAERRQREEWAERVRKAQEAERVWKAEEAERRKAQEAERLRRAEEAKKHDEFLWQFLEDLPTEYSNTRETFQPAKQTKTGSERSQRGKRSRAGNTMGGQWGEASDIRDSLCLHRSWWEKEDGRHECERCLDTTRRFAFRCPSCRMVACADCRNILKRRL
ncbi:DnaJ-domain-containing protein [Trichoderma citrinoviride]|uniref:DnaJ-domain-containing protein n=1 Tax=Trichoderma citrinoviride TaxID=58853 RepID=A0A2T4B932_9HYPO|nr:DnaJ-domain-containing protein [Trichoderma citrinoviride]PTB65721.1 DnaJ-domain-containing protein [Trichoderma citrinoviride]